MATSATALVQHGAGKFEFENIPLPKLSKPGSAIIRVEANGLCHSDVDDFHAHVKSPRIIGHEIVGVIEELGPKSFARGDLRVGDRVAVAPFVSCGVCQQCLSGDNTMCTGYEISPFTYGHIPTSVAPSLWGGYSTHVYADTNTVLYKIPEHVSALDATLWNPLSAGFQWAVTNGGVGIGTKLLIMGAGQRGLASIFGSRKAGADVIAVTGLSRDAAKLKLATEFGADAVIDVETEDVIDRAREITGGTGFDVILDTTPYATQPVIDAVEMVRPGGTIVLGGFKGRSLNAFPIDKAIVKRVRIITALGQSDDAQQQSVNLIASGDYPMLSKMRTHVFGYDRLEHAIAVLEGKVPGEKGINVVVTPTRTD